MGPDELKYAVSLVAVVVMDARLPLWHGPGPLPLLHPRPGPPGRLRHGGRFPGGKTRTVRQKLAASKLPLFDPDADLTVLDELQAEIADRSARIQATDQIIDQIVYRLYGLSDEEIAVVEGA